MSIDNNNRQPKPYFDIKLESDRWTKLYASFQYEEDNRWELKIDRVPGQSITAVVIINGIERTLVGTLDKAARKLNIRSTCPDKTYNVDVQMNPNGEWGFTVKGDVEGPIDAKMTLKKDYKTAELVVKHNNKNYAFVKVTGDATVQRMPLYGVWMPTKADYTMKYNILDSQMEGKAKINFDARTPKKTLKISVVPKTGRDLSLDYAFEMTPNYGWKFDYEAIRGGISFFKQHSEWNVITNDVQKYEATTKDEITMSTESMLYPFYCQWAGKCWTTGTRERHIAYHKNNRNFFLGKMLFEDKAILDGVKYDEKKLDTTSTPYVLTLYNPTGPLLNTQHLFGMDLVEVKVWHMIGRELKFETNIADMKMTIRRSPDYFFELIKNGETILKSHTEITPAEFKTEMNTLMYLQSNTLFHKIFCAYGSGCFSKREGHMKFTIDRLNKNAYLNKYSIESSIKKDDVKVFELKHSTMTTPYTFHVNAPHILPQVFNDPNRRTIEATITHHLGRELDIRTNMPEFETFKVTTQGSSRTIVLNGRELVVVDYVSGAKKITQAIQLPNGEHMTTSVEWARDTMQANKVKVKVEVTPDRKFDGTFDWDLTDLHAVNMKMDIKGENPVLGTYEITRIGAFTSTRTSYDVKWTGKSAFTKGPIAPFTPVGTDFKVTFDKNTKALDASIVKVIGGKKWGFTVDQNRFSLLSGRP